jgi:hypothetical protein
LGWPSPSVQSGLSSRPEGHAAIPPSPAPSLSRAAALSGAGATGWRVLKEEETGRPSGAGEGA